MFDLIVHSTLVFIMTLLLGSSLIRFMLFISSQGLLGAYGLHYPALRTKSLQDWSENEKQYVMTRILTDVLLVTVFILQHSLMARDCWRRCLLRFNVYVSERLIYIIVCCLALTLMINRWVSTPDVLLWAIDTEKRPLLWLFFFLLHAAAWLIILCQVRLMDPLEFLGLKQLYYYHNNRSAPISYMSTSLRLFYQHMRHGGTTCLWLMLWVHPVMTLDRFLLALCFSFYLPMAQRVTLSDYKFSSSYFTSRSCTSMTTTVKRRVY